MIRPRGRRVTACVLALVSLTHVAAAEEPPPSDEALVPADVTTGEPRGGATSGATEVESHPGFRFAYGGAAPLTLPSTYRPFAWGDAVLGGAAAGVALGAILVGPREDGLDGRIAFDESIRDALRSDDASARRAARTVSDVLVGLSFTYALAVDPFVNAAWLRKSPKVGLQVFLLNLEVTAVAVGVQQVVANSVSRERPYVRECGGELAADDDDCVRLDRNRSFYSGHTTHAFALAAATCTHHAHLRLGGNEPWIACLSGMSVATATGVLRLVADRHYATDILVGAAVGALIGWSVPFFHYRTGRPPLGVSLGSVELGLAPTPNGVAVFGVMP